MFYLLPSIVWCLCKFPGCGLILWESLRSTSMEGASSTLTSTSRFLSESQEKPTLIKSELLIGSQLSHLGERAGSGKEQEQRGGWKSILIPPRSPLSSNPGFHPLPIQVTQIMDTLYGGGGDYHTSYWPQPSYLSSRKYYIESTFQCENYWLKLKLFINMLFLPSAYHELDFTVEDRNTIYWHHTVPKYSHHTVFSPNSSKVFLNPT